jgi:hypothetical protein
MNETVQGKHMMKLLACLVLTLCSPLASSAAEGQFNIEKGSVDPFTNDVLSKPFTIFDQLLYGLGKEAAEKVMDLRSKNEDYRVAKQHSYISTEVRYEKENSRVVVGFDITVSGMNDPWRDVCKRQVIGLSELLHFYALGSQVATYESGEGKAWRVHYFFKHYLGHKWSKEDMPAASLQPFIDSLVVIGGFKVAGNDGYLAYLRYCALHINDGHISYYEHKY